MASSDISFFLMDPYNYFGFCLPDSIEKRALYHACCKLLANVLLAIVFLTLLLLDDISKSLFLITETETKHKIMLTTVANHKKRNTSKRKWELKVDA